MKKKGITAMLSLFLGSWGGQHFYLGNIGKGVLSFIFSFTLIPAIIGIVDAIKFLTMSEEEFDAKYNYYHHLAKMKSDWQSQAFLNRNVAEELEKLANLMDKGLITFEEFEKRKKKLLG